MSVSRREFVGAAGLLGLAPVVAAAGSVRHDGRVGSDEGWEAWPRQEVAMVSAVVGAAHRDLGRVRELVEARPALARAAWDWGFGDWETALGAASHTGQREIALLLMEHGARPDIFTFAMLGNVGAVRAMVEGSPGVQRIRGPHGISLLRHARAGGDEAAGVVAYLESLGDAGAEEVAEALGDVDAEACVGMYRVEGAEGVEFVIERGRGGGLVFKRGAGVNRGLRHLGRREFAPVGAEGVRIGFDAGSPCGGVTVRDGEVAVRGVRGG